MTQISNGEATMRVLRLIDSPLVDDIMLEPDPGTALNELTVLYPRLSSGEKRLVDIARAIWTGSESGVGSVATIGNLDTERQRAVLSTLHALYVGDVIRLSEADVEAVRAKCEHRNVEGNNHWALCIDCGEEL